MKYLLAILLLLCLTACEFMQSKSAVPLPPNEEANANNLRVRPVSRFVSIPEITGLPLYGIPRPFLALDTMTGDLCRTWDFKWPDPSDAQKTLQFLPTCHDLYIKTSGDYQPKTPAAQAAEQLWKQVGITPDGKK